MARRRNIRPKVAIVGRGRYVARMTPPERTTARKQVYLPVRVRDAAMAEAALLGQSWSVFVSRGLEHLLAVRQPEEGWQRYPEFEDA